MRSWGGPGKVPGGSEGSWEALEGGPEASGRVPGRSLRGPGSSSRVPGGQDGVLDGSGRFEKDIWRGPGRPFFSF